MMMVWIMIVLMQDAVEDDLAEIERGIAAISSCKY